MPPKKKSNEEVVEQEVEETEVPVVSDPYMAVQGSPVAPIETFKAKRDGNRLEVIAPYEWGNALDVFLRDYGTTDLGWRIGTHKQVVVHVLSIFPPCRSISINALYA